MERLPPEVGEQSLKLISLKDLCSVALTSSRVRTLASNPTLWSNMRVNKEKIEQDGLAKLFSIKRFSKIRKIDLSWIMFSSEEELQRNLKTISSSCVEDLSLEHVNLRHDVPVDLLAQTVGHVRKINLDNTNLSTPQCFAVLETCISSPTLVDLSMEGANFLEVPAALLGEAAAHLHSLGLHFCSSTSEHCRAVLESCVSSPALINVSLGNMDSMSGVDASLLARAAVNLKKLNLDSAPLTTEQSIALLETCNGTSKLVSLSLRNNLGLLEEVPVLLLKQAVGHLRMFDLFCTDLTTEQSYALLEACIANTTSKIVIHPEFVGFLAPEDLLDLLDRARDTGRLTHFE